jgi:hypothetical protein
MPIVKFQAGGQDVEFKDWMGTNAAVLNVRVTVLYDAEKPSLAMIDRPVWNWIPWAPTLGMGLFLILVGVRVDGGEVVVGECWSTLPSRQGSLKVDAANKEKGGSIGAALFC